MKMYQRRFSRRLVAQQKNMMDLDERLEVDGVTKDRKLLEDMGQDDCKGIEQLGVVGKHGDKDIQQLEVMGQGIKDTKQLEDTGFKEIQQLGDTRQQGFKNTEQLEDMGQQDFEFCEELGARGQQEGKEVGEFESSVQLCESIEYDDKLLMDEDNKINVMNLDGNKNVLHPAGENISHVPAISVMECVMVHNPKRSEENDKTSRASFFKGLFSTHGTKVPCISNSDYGNSIDGECCYTSVENDLVVKRLKSEDDLKVKRLKSADYQEIMEIEMEVDAANVIKSESKYDLGFGSFTGREDLRQNSRSVENTNQTDSFVGNNLDALANGEQDDDSIAHGEQNDDALDHGEQDDDSLAHGEQNDDALDHGEQDDDAFANAEQDDDPLANGEQDDDALDHGEQDNDALDHGEQDDDALANGEQIDDALAHGEQDDDPLVNGEQDDDAHANGEQDDDAHANGEQEDDALAHGEENDDAHANGEQDDFFENRFCEGFHNAMGMAVVDMQNERKPLTMQHHYVPCNSQMFGVFELSWRLGTICCDSVHTDVAKHVASHRHEATKFKCNNCKIKFLKSEIFLDHIKKHHSGTSSSLKCLENKCRLLFPTAFSLWIHQQEYHVEEAEKVKMKCNSCSKKVKDAKDRGEPGGEVFEKVMDAKDSVEHEGEVFVPHIGEHALKVHRELWI